MSFPALRSLFFVGISKAPSQVYFLILDLIRKWHFRLFIWMGSHCRALFINRHSFHSRTDEIEIEFFFFVFSRLREKIGPKHLCSSLVLLRLHHLMHRTRLTCVSHSPRARSIRNRPPTLSFTIAGQILVSALSERWKSAKQTFGDDSRVKTHKRNKSISSKTTKNKTPDYRSVSSARLTTSPLNDWKETEMYFCVVFFVRNASAFGVGNVSIRKKSMCTKKALSRCFDGMSKQVSALFIAASRLAILQWIISRCSIGSLWNCARSLWKRFSLNGRAMINDLERW